VKKRLGQWLCLGGVLSGVWAMLASSAQAIPGQSVDEAQTWMQAHPTLRATPQDRLLVRRADNAARRFTFQGSLFPPGGISAEDGTPGILRRDRNNLNTVRMERFNLVDMVNGVSLLSLEEALRVLYGPDIYADYRRSQATYAYPESSPDRLLRPDRRALRGELRLGEQFAYWIEFLPNSDGSIESGTISVLLKEDLPALQTTLQQ
jgi:hypothetical protein